jgi:hypothetical protein
MGWAEGSTWEDQPGQAFQLAQVEVSNLTAALVPGFGCASLT